MRNKLTQFIITIYIYIKTVIIKHNIIILGMCLLLKNNSCKITFLKTSLCII